LPSSAPVTGAGENNHAPVHLNNHALVPAPQPIDPSKGASADARRQALAEPSWGQVLVTTIRLWLERRVLRRRPLVAVLILVAVVFAAGALTVALSSGVTSRTGRAGGNDSPPGGSLRVAAADRQQAAKWIHAQVSQSATVACDPVMCSALQTAGFPVGNLLVLNSAAGDPLGSAIVVSTDAIRSEFGVRLTSVYAPVIIASFGSGTARVDVRVTAADGARAYLSELSTDRLQRQSSGRQLLGNQHFAAAAAAGRALAAGEVDARLLSTLAVLAGTANLSMDVLAFGDTGPGASPGVPMRSAVIEVRTGGKQPASTRYLQSVLSFLRAQEAPFRATSMTVARAAGQPVLRIEFAAPSPLLLLGSGAP